MKAIIPHTLIWLPFVPEILDFALKRIFRISFCGYASTILICPVFLESKYLSTFFNNPKHSSILLNNPVNFCSYQCTLLLLNFENSLHLTVDNDFSGIFSVHPQTFQDFVPWQSKSLISHTSTDTNCDLVPSVEAKLAEAFKLENSRLESRFQCPNFPALTVNNFLRKSFPFDVTSVAFHYSSPALVRKYFPKSLFPQRHKKPISYQKYNEMCEDDSKITRNSLPSEDLFALCAENLVMKLTFVGCAYALPKISDLPPPQI